MRTYRRRLEELPLLVVQICKAVDFAPHCLHMGELLASSVGMADSNKPLVEETDGDEEDIIEDINPVLR